MAGKYYRSFEHLLRPDPVYKSPDVAKFISCVMRDGKRSTAERIFYDALKIIEQRVSEREPVEVFHQAVDNVKPMVEVRSKRIGGANYQVPVEVNAKRRRTLAYRWLLEAARGRRGRPMHVSLADELVAAYNKEGGAILKRENAHKQAEANKAFAHFAF
ncbi:MAG: 30S ribosomal protein S7 [Planctomycetota bacterium]|nr:30S ribosomal protein S7 [Planctomycetota bacterium]